jgi:hypothetical protein
MQLSQFIETVRTALGSRHLTVIAHVHVPEGADTERHEWWGTVPDPAARHTIKFLPPRNAFADVGECPRLRLIGWHESNKGQAEVTREQIAGDDGTLACKKAAEILRQFP